MFSISDVVGSVANGVLPEAGGGNGGPVATDPPPLVHEPAHAHLEAMHDSNPAAGNAERQGIIIIGGDSLHGGLHPAVASLGTGLGKGGLASCPGFGCSLDDFRDSPRGGGVCGGPAPEGGGFSGFLHTIANLGRG